MPAPQYKSYVFDFDKTITKIHTRGYPLYKGDGTPEFTFDDTLAAMAEKPGAYLKDGFLELLYDLRQRTPPVPIYIATRGPINNAIFAINRAFADRNPGLPAPFSEANVIGAGSAHPDGQSGIMDIDSIGADKKHGVLTVIQSKLARVGIKASEALFVDDDDENLPTAEALGFAVCKQQQTQDPPVKDNDFFIKHSQMQQFTIPDCKQIMAIYRQQLDSKTMRLPSFAIDRLAEFKTPEALIAALADRAAENPTGTSAATLQVLRTNYPQYMADNKVKGHTRDEYLAAYTPENPSFTKFLLRFSSIDQIRTTLAQRATINEQGASNRCLKTLGI